MSKYGVISGPYFPAFGLNTVGLGLFMSYLYDLLFVFSLIIKTDVLVFFYIFLEYLQLFLDDNVGEESE